MSAPAPTTPAASIDSPKFRNMLATWSEHNEDWRIRRASESMDAIIADIDAHTARAVAAAVAEEDARTKALCDVLQQVTDDRDAARHTIREYRAAAPQQHAQAALSEQQVCDLLRDKSLLTEFGMSRVMNGDFVSLNLTAITAICNAASHQPAAAPAQPEVKP